MLPVFSQAGSSLLKPHRGIAAGGPVAPAGHLISRTASNLRFAP